MLPSLYVKLRKSSTKTNGAKIKQTMNNRVSQQKRINYDCKNTSKK
jgi:hypothetical protein